MKQTCIVDDDQEMSKAMSMMFTLLDFETTCFPNARSAVQALFSGNRPDLLVLDIHMPEVSGLDMLEFLRRRDEWNDLPVIMLSTEAADVTVDKSISLGADGYAMKPVTIDELEKTINAALEKYK
jgi:DNA-binding response OmpR family regulator